MINLMFRDGSVFIKELDSEIASARKKQAAAG